MKKLLLVALVSTLAIGGYATMNTFSTNVASSDFETKRTDIEICKTSIKFAHAYKDTMAQDGDSLAALDYYKKDVVDSCGKICSVSAS